MTPPSSFAYSGGGLVMTSIFSIILPGRASRKSCNCWALRLTGLSSMRTTGVLPLTIRLPLASVATSGTLSNSSLALAPALRGDSAALKVRLPPLLFTSGFSAAGRRLYFGRICDANERDRGFGDGLGGLFFQ